MDVFCYALALKGASRKGDLLGLLPEDHRNAIADALREIENLPQGEIRLRWKRARVKQLDEQQAEIKPGLGKGLRVSPRLLAWISRPF